MPVDVYVISTVFVHGYCCWTLVISTTGAAHKCSANAATPIVMAAVFFIFYSIRHYIGGVAFPLFPSCSQRGSGLPYTKHKERIRHVYLHVARPRICSVSEIVQISLKAQYANCVHVPVVHPHGGTPSAACASEVIERNAGIITKNPIQFKRKIQCWAGHRKWRFRALRDAKYRYFE